MTRVAAMTMKQRKDEVTDGFCAADILKNAPAVDDGYFVVPKIVESGRGSCTVPFCLA